MLKKIFLVICCILFCWNDYAARYKSCSLQKSENDISVIFIDTTKTDYTSIAFCISVGSADELGINGIANLLGNLFYQDFKNTIESNDKLIGTDVRFTIDYDKSIFYVNCKSENAEEILKCFGEKFTNLSFTNEDIDSVRNNIAKQISEQKTDSALLYNEARKNLYWHSKYGDNIYGTSEGVNNISSADIVDFKSRLYRNNRLFIVISSYSDKSSTMKTIQKFFSKNEPGEIKRLQEPTHHSSTTKIVKTSESADSTVIQMFWTVPCFRTSPTEASAIEILAVYIEEILKKILIEEQQIATSVSVKTSLWNYCNGEIILTVSIPNSIDIEYAENAILAELKSVQKLTKEQADKIAQKLSNSYSLTNAEVSKVVPDIAQKIASGNDFNFVKELPMNILKYDFEKLNLYFKQNPQVISIIKRRDNVLPTNDSK